MLWRVFLDTHPRRHLVVAGFPDADCSSATRQARFALLKQLTDGLKPVGTYAIANINLDGRAEIHVGYEQQPDAEKLTAAVAANATLQYPGWQSQATFSFDHAAQKKVQSVLNR